MKNISLFSVFLILSFSCKDSNQKSDSTVEFESVQYPIMVDVSGAMSNEEIPLLSNLAYDVSYIKLKTPKDIIIKLIRDVQISKENIFIHEGLSEKVMVFDMEGNFIRLIGKRGRGPNEYINLISFCFDKNTEDLLFYTGNSGNVLKYRSDGTFIGRLFNFSYADYMYSLDNLFIFSGITGPTKGMPDGITQFATINMSGEIIDSVPLPIYSIDNWRKKNLWFPGNFPSTKFDKTILLYSMGEDTIFHVTDSGNITQRYHLDFGKYNNPVETRYIAGSPEIRNQRNNYITAISPPFETSKNLWCKFAFQ
jgi:hypothetical protein